jgi:signal transduction histidine kinase
MSRRVRRSPLGIIVFRSDALTLGDAPALRRRSLVLWTLGAAGVATLAATATLTATSEHATERALWITGSALVTMGFLAAGLFAWARRPDNTVGPLMIAVAFGWLLSDLVFADDPWLFSVGQITKTLFIAVTLHLLLVFPAGRFESRGDRLAAAAGYVAAAVLYPAAYVFALPARFDCAGCPENTFLIADNKELADVFSAGASYLFATVAVAIIWSLIRRWRGATPVQRQALGAVLFAGLALLTVLFAVTVLGPITGGDATVLTVISIAALVPFGLVPYVFLGSLARARMLRGGAFGELVARLSEAPGPGGMRDALASALGDPSLELAYWLPESQRFADAHGKAVEPPCSNPARAVSEVRLEGRLVAAMIHDASLLEDPGLVRGVSAAAALALENERLGAELRAKVDELRSSRTRMIEAGLAERRRLERDLHDGAQQRLVSLALELRMAEDRLEDDPESARELLDAASHELDAALAELRELARGIHPALLTDRGLDAALETLAHRAPVPVELQGTPGERLPEPVELAAYFVVTEALTNVAKYAHASRASVRAERRDGHLFVEVSDDGVGGADPSRGSGLRGLADRLSALEGRLDVHSENGDGTTVRAKIPLETIP